MARKLARRISSFGHVVAFSAIFMPPSLTGGKLELFGNASYSITAHIRIAGRGYQNKNLAMR